jgi:hypothetical protein
MGNVAFDLRWGVDHRGSIEAGVSVQRLGQRRDGRVSDWLALIRSRWDGHNITQRNAALDRQELVWRPGDADVQGLQG